MTEIEPDRDREEAGAATEPEQQAGSPRLWHVIAIVVFVLGLWTPFREVLREDLEVVVPIFPRTDSREMPTMKQRFWAQAIENDQVLVAWLVSRNARVLATQPWNLFEVDQCHPTRNALAYGEPMITLGLLGIPGHLLGGGDPLVTYNSALLVMTLLAAFAMYLLVADWTRSRPAGIAAGLFYAYAPVKLANVSHPFVNDTTWTVLALLFARRFFASGRLMDGLLLAIFCVLQMAGSFYPFLASVFLAAPLLVWLLRAYGLRKLHPVPVLAAAAALAIGVGLVYGPYLLLHDSPEITGRAQYAFAAIGEFVPGGERFPGWLVLALVAAGIVLGRERSLPGVEGDPRPALGIACGLILVIALGPELTAPLPSPYTLLAALLPGLDSVRIPGQVASGFHLAICLLAGMGAAATLRALPSLIPQHFVLHASIILVALSFVVTTRPAWLGLESRVVYRPLAIRPPDATLRFYAELADRDNRGPVLEVPMYSRARGPRATRILMAGYHRRRISACTNSYMPIEYAEVEEIAATLPAPEAISRAREMGFTTIVAHHDPESQVFVYYTGPLDRVAALPDGRLRRIHASPTFTAYEILPEPTGSGE